MKGREEIVNINVKNILFLRRNSVVSIKLSNILITESLVLRLDYYAKLRARK